VFLLRFGVHERRGQKLGFVAPLFPPPSQFCGSQLQDFSHTLDESGYWRNLGVTPWTRVQPTSHVSYSSVSSRAHHDSGWHARLARMNEVTVTVTPIRSKEKKNSNLRVVELSFAELGGSVHRLLTHVTLRRPMTRCRGFFLLGGLIIVRFRIGRTDVRFRGTRKFH